ncbi:MAG: MarR family transcriptional regulator [Acidimicrobiia bacterium]|nr:MarR family transcriptional regulator [Acidimicrobiia bacterium]
MNHEELAYIEHVGRFWESFGGSRMAGRILGRLMTCHPAHQSSAQLAEALQASAGSISTQTRTLETIGLIDRITFPGDRSTYFLMREGAWADVLGAKIGGIQVLHDIALAGRSLVGDDRADRVDDLLAVTEFFGIEYPLLMERMKAQMAERAQEGTT